MSQANPTKPHPKAKCKGCGARLLVPTENGLCRFCSIERGYEEPV